MTDRPMLFQDDMVRGIYGDYKTKTRREVKPKNGGVQWNPNDIPGMRQILRNCPHGNVGDRIWVKETYFAFGHWEQRFSDKKGRNEWHFVDQTLERGGAYKYEADGIPFTFVDRKRQENVNTWWRRSSLFMPRAASRLTLEITDVHIERLQDISEADAIAEGCIKSHNGYYRGGPHAVSGFKQMAAAKSAYNDLWTSINGPGSWQANPWVWVISFRRVTNEVNE